MRAIGHLLICGWIAFGQQETAKSQNSDANQQAAAESSKAIDDFQADAAEYVIRLANRPKQKLTLHDEPLLHWGNPARKSFCFSNRETKRAIRLGNKPVRATITST